MANHIRIFFSTILVLVLAVIISQTLKVEDIGKIIFDFPKSQLLLFFGLSIAISYLKAWRFLLLLHNSAIPISLWETSKVYIASQTTSPLPGGETLRAMLVNQETATPVKKITGVIVTQGLLELTSAAVIVIIGSFYYEEVRLPAIAALVILSSITTLLLNKKYFALLLNKFPNSKFVHNLKLKLFLMQKGLLLNVKNSRHSITKTFIVSICTHLLGGLLVYAIASAYGVNLNFFVASFIYATGIVVAGLIAIIPGGLGVTEGGMTGLLLLNNVSIGQAFGIILIFRFVTLFFSVLLGLIFFILFYARAILLSPELRKN